MHRARGAFCHDGWCQQCKITLPDGRAVLACQQHARGAQVPRLSWSWKRLLGLVAERMPPWFYEGHFLWPRTMRQRYLSWLRGASGALVLPQAGLSEDDHARRWRRLSTDVLVVGAGRSGLTAAQRLAKAGRRVLVVERKPLDADLAPPAVAAALRAARDAGCDIHTGSLCVGLYTDPQRALCAADGGMLSVEYQVLVVATGAYDKWLVFPGSDLPGIIGARAFLSLIDQRTDLQGLRIGVYAAEDAAAGIVARVRDAGVGLGWVAGPGSLPPGPMPSLPNAPLDRAYGRGRLRAVTIGGRRMACDLLVLGFSQPTYELQAQAGARMTLSGMPPIVTPVSQDPSLLVVGAAVGGDRAQADTIARVESWLRGEAPAAAEPAQVHETLATQAPEAILCPCEDVRVRDLQGAIRDGYRDIELIKRHTGVGTGPCQGKLCHGAMLQCLAAEGLDVRIPTPRPLVRPVPLRMFLGADDD